MALEAAAIHEAAEQARALARLCNRLRGEITIHLRDTGKIIDAALGESRQGDWQAFQLALMPLSRRLSRQASREMLEERRDALLRLRAEVETAYLDSLNEQEMSGNAADSERDYQNSNPESHFEYSSEKELKQSVGPMDATQAEKISVAKGRESGGHAPETKGEPVPLGYLLTVCPTLATYARDGIANWADVLKTVGLVRSMLGISPDAWQQARTAMGEFGAAITVAAILERVESIRSPGGYLRALTERAFDGKFSVRPMLAALEKRPDGGPA